MEGWNTVSGQKHSSRWHHVKTLWAVTVHEQVVVGSAVFRYNYQSRNSLRHVVTRDSGNTLQANEQWTSLHIDRVVRHCEKWRTRSHWKVLTGNYFSVARSWSKLKPANYLVSFSFWRGQQQKRISQTEICHWNLLHHDSTRAVYCQNIVWEKLFIYKSFDEWSSYCFVASCLQRLPMIESWTN